MKKILPLIGLLLLLNACKEEPVCIATINNVTINDIYGSSATLNATISYTNSYGTHPTISEYGVYISATNKEPSSKDDIQKTKFESEYSWEYLENMVFTITNLQPSTTYHVRPFLRNAVGTIEGEVHSFTTKGTAGVNTKDATNITVSTATLHGNITFKGTDVSLTKRGFVLSVSGTPTLENNIYEWNEASTKQGDFSRQISRLTGNTLYYFRAYAVVDGKAIYGGTRTFTTAVPQDAITLTLNAATNVSTTTAQVTGNISMGVDAVVPTQLGFLCSSSSSTPTYYDYDYRTTTADVHNGNYSANFNSLTPNTTYYYRMYYYQSGSYYYSDARTFTTANASSIGSAKTIAEFKALPDDANTYYSLTGVIWYIDNSTYGNFYLIDETGVLPVYGLTSTKRVSNDQSFASLGLSAGDNITISGTKNTYGGYIEARYSYLVSKNEKLTYENGFTTYYTEPSNAGAITLSDVSSIYVYRYDYDYISYTDIDVHLYFSNGDRFVLEFDLPKNNVDADIILPAQTYNVKSRTSSEYPYLRASTGVYVSSYISEGYSSFTRAGSAFGERAIYAISGGYVTVSKSGGNALMNFNLQSYFGSSITGTLTVDLKSNLRNTSAPERKAPPYDQW